MHSGGNAFHPYFPLAFPEVTGHITFYPIFEGFTPPTCIHISHYWLFSIYAMPSNELGKIYLLNLPL